MGGGGVTVLVSCLLLPREYDAIRVKLQQMGYVHIITDPFLQSIEAIWILQNESVKDLLLRNQEAICKVFDLLKDAHSQEVYCRNLQAHSSYEYSKAIVSEDMIDYVDVKVPFQKGYSHFIDCGAYTGDTFLTLLKHHRVQEYYGFEPAAETFPVFSHTVSDFMVKHKERQPRVVALYPCATGKENRYCKFTIGKHTDNFIDDENGTEIIQMVRIDDVIKSEQITMLKMDIEGAEIDTLYGAKELITSQKPDLAICVYHNISDIWEIPLLLHGWVPEYQFYLRAHAVATLETVLYATIKN